tara:strand:+ start:208 stop:408 length:201 start_codon:yes stop_codon:yes gene_type:complete
MCKYYCLKNKQKEIEMKKEIDVILDLTKQLREADKEIKKLNRMIEMICEGYTFVKTQLPPYNKKEK